MKTLAKSECREEVLARVARLRPDSARQWGSMSPHQTVCHLADATRMALGEKTTRARASFPMTVLVKTVALYLPMRWPEGIATSPELQLGSGGTPPAEFAADLDELCSLTGRLLASPVLTPTHPVFGRMSRQAWLRWGYLHLDHHLRQFGE
jgi:hypothetical protein